ncbi:Gfo/Idh/MocA family protein [Actinokineospora fastidiosa]|uniref:Dehydrogenase n=1 Tax=Actinokineospora fastidiosa TaxID=1816 RepID=A0A918GLL8_9PSEU|nr:Gfo/Idh/MocA family oxidoreductase [Actinokineospora fastidiosa]GGS45018.1 dehydrogenase [Actinokineospora fastidiosa]
MADRAADHWRIGVLSGTGTALKRTIPALRESELCRVSVVHGRNPDRLRAAAQHAPHAKLVTDEREFEELAAHYDVVFIGSPPFLHPRHIALAVRLGKPILCEKPLVSRPDDLAAVVDTLSGHDIPFMLAHQLRHQEAVRHISSLVTGGELGVPVAATLQWCFRMNHDAPNARWKADPARGGASALTDCGVHCLDLAAALFGHPESVAASAHSVKSASTMDTVVVLLSCGGLPVMVVASQQGHPGANDLTITFSDGLVQAKGMLGEAALPAVTWTQGSATTTRSFDPVNLYRAEVEDFCRSLSNGHSVGTTLADAVAVCATVFAAEESARRGETVTIKR